MAVMTLTDSNFKKEVLDYAGVVMVDFWAPWCGPCKMMSPIIDELAEGNQQNIKVCKLNVDENPAVSTEYAVLSIPTLLFFKNGKPIEQFVGAANRGQLRNKISQLLS